MANVSWDTTWQIDQNSGTTGAWAISSDEPGNEGGLQNSDPLGTAVILSLFTDARLPDHMIGRFGFTRNDQREWHGNTFAVDEQNGEHPLGSLLWTLRRAPLTSYSCRVAEHFAAEALQPLIRQGLASDFDIDATMDKSKDAIILHIVAHGAGEREFTAELYSIR